MAAGRVVTSIVSGAVNLGAIKYWPFSPSVVSIGIVVLVILHVTLICGVHLCYLVRQTFVHLP